MEGMELPSHNVVRSVRDGGVTPVLGGEVQHLTHELLDHIVGMVTGDTRGLGHLLALRIRYHTIEYQL